MKHENAYTIISIIGKDNAKKLHKLIGSEPISFAAVNKVIQKEEIEESFRKGKPIEQVVVDHNISRRNAYRFFAEIFKCKQPIGKK